MMQIHVVNRGDTLSALAQRYGVSLDDIVLVNDIDDPDVLVVGQTLVIPQMNREYVVKPGDSLSIIATKYGITVQQLREANNITNSDLIFVGDLLVIPQVRHTVRSGETVWAIAKRYGVSVEQIVAANQMDNPSKVAVGEILTIPLDDRPTTEVNAYSTDTTDGGKEEVLVLGRHFTYLSPFMYAVQANGTLDTMQDTLLLEAAEETNTLPLLVITNFRNSRFDSDLAASILRNPTLQETLITNILQTMREKGYQGLNIDFEYVYPQDRENYNAFLRRVVARLHPENYLVSTALAPKERADQPGLLYEAHDYKAHGEIVDFVVLMTYEWGWAGGPPWAIAPINKVKDVLDYAVTDIPPEKILLGVPLYGRDWEIPWQEGTFARTISPQGALQLAEEHKVNIQYNETYEAPFFRYVDDTGQRHEVWFEDARSVQAKYRVVKDYKLRGISYWVLGQPFPQNWPVLQNHFRVVKKKLN